MKHRPFLSLGIKRTWPPLGTLTIAFLFGGVGYGLLEILWRGYTHPSMVLTGGLCFVTILFLNRKLMRLPLLFRSIFCTLLVTAVEFVVGIVVNLILHLGVWDYSDEKFHLLGQICAEYAFFWFLLCTALSLAISTIFRMRKI